MLSFLLTRRWLGFAAAVVAMAIACTWLSMWQFDRLEDRKATNKIVEANYSADPVPVQTLSQPGADLDRSNEWRPVIVTGRYDSSLEFTLKYQTRNKRPGIEVVTPLLLDDGTAVLVNRGWIESSNTSEHVEGVPPPPDGNVEVVGWLRQNGTATGQAITPSDRQVRSLSSDGLVDWVSRPLVNGYIDLKEQQPAGAQGLTARPEPDLSNGPHFSYGLQWVFFGLLALFGLGYFAWLEIKDKRERPKSPVNA